MTEKQSKKLRFEKEESSVDKVEKSESHSRRQPGAAKPKAKGQSPPDIPQEKPSKKLKAETEASKSAKKKLRFDKADVTVDEGISEKSVLAGRATSRALAVASAEAHRAVADANDHDNVGVEAANDTEGAGEVAVRRVKRKKNSEKLKKSKQAQKLDGKGKKCQGTVDGEEKSNSISRMKQRQNIKAQYAAAARNGGKAASSGKAASEAAKEAERSAYSVGSNAVHAVGEAAKSAGSYVVGVVTDNPHLVIALGAVVLLVMIIMMMVSSCTFMMPSGLGGVWDTSFTAEDDDIKTVENDYKELEKKLQQKINQIPTTYPGYDEYDYQLDEIGHDPYQLAAYLTVKFEAYEPSEVQAELESLFEKQYKLTVTTEVQIRYRVVTVPIPVPPYVTTEIQPYTYKILHVKLENKELDTVIRTQCGLDEDDTERYEVLQETRGNRDDLFGDVAYAVPDSNPLLDYNVSAEALTDPEFAVMLEEAEKYLDTAYVWGGSTPETGFDCAGYVCWVLNQSGWDVGRQNANGLWNMSEKLTESEAKPGDLVFFEGTYDTEGASHVGLYVGNGMMISAGNPIKYSNIHSSYWAGHLLGFGRIPK